MAAKPRQRGGVWEFMVKVAKIRKEPFYFYFADVNEGAVYVERVEKLLREGLVPPELLEENKKYLVIADVIRDYLLSAHMTVDDRTLLNTLIERVGSVSLGKVTYNWVEGWIREMKTVRNLSPASIRHYVGALARCFDWGSRKRIVELAVNPIRLLPKSYATYNEGDIKLLNEKQVVKESLVERDRRIEGDEEKILKETLAHKRPVHGTRDEYFFIDYRPAYSAFWETALESAMRMRENYTLTVEQVDFERRTIFLDKTKNGDKRQVPMSSVLIKSLQHYLQLVKDGHPEMLGWNHPDGRLWPFWDGSFEDRDLKNTTIALSKEWKGFSEAAGVMGFRFHDLRHEATSRLFERTKMSDTEIMKITGHKGTRMLIRYANLRGSDLAAKMW